MNREGKVMLDFSSVQVEMEIDKFKEMDISKAVGNGIRMGTNDIGLDDWCREVYHHGKAETPVEWLPVLKNILGSHQVPLVIATKQAAAKVIDAAIASVVKK